ncbi:hypothetical protein SynA15127_02786 [Synechococcus sp. A15-127]|nr:hypothetical protein SynA15127_02786 [Synechococcus sp. A15-127]
MIFGDLDHPRNSIEMVKNKNWVIYWLIALITQAERSLLCMFSER